MSRPTILRIGFASHEEVKRRTMEIVSGKRRRDPKEPLVWFTSPQAFAQVLSKKNMALLEMIRASNPASIAELAESCGREVSNLHRTLKTLERYGFVILIDGTGGRKAPRVTFDRVETSWDLAA